MADIDAVLDLMNACEAAEGERSEWTLDELREAWTRPGFDLSRDAWLMFASDGRLAGYIEVRELQTASIESDGYVHPGFEGRGIGTLLLTIAEHRARSVERHLELDRHPTVSGGVSTNNLAAVRLFEQLGFRPVRYFLLEEINFDDAPPRPEWPREVTVRRFKPGEDMAPVYTVVQEAFKDHWGDRHASLEQWTHSWREGGMDPSLWFIAESGGAIAGVSLCKMRRERGHVRTLGVLRRFRRHGLGLALLRESFSEFYRRRVTTVDLGVDAESLTGATRLYQRAGMREARRFAIYRKAL
jgi:ribosomal protein S18 acetylase RimI-like enzyme